MHSKINPTTYIDMEKHLLATLRTVLPVILNKFFAPFKPKFGIFGNFISPSFGTLK